MTSPFEFLGRAAAPVGVLPHVRRIGSRLVSRRTVVGAFREVRGLGQHIALYPFGFRSRPLEAYDDPHATDTLEVPVVLVHGYFHNRSGFFVLARALRRRGFRWVYAMNYNPVGETIPSLAAQLARHVEDVLSVSGAPRVHIVGHSLGGLIARWYVQELGGEQFVDHCVTIGTPHEGTYTAYVGLGQTAREMRPGSSLLQRLRAGLARCTTTFVNLYSDLDVLIVPPSSAILRCDRPGPKIHNRLMQDLGHTSLLISPELIAFVAEGLAKADAGSTLAQVRRLRSAAEGPSAVER